MTFAILESVCIGWVYGELHLLSHRVSFTWHFEPPAPDCSWHLNKTLFLFFFLFAFHYAYTLI